MKLNAILVEAEVKKFTEYNLNVFREDPKVKKAAEDIATELNLQVEFKESTYAFTDTMKIYFIGPEAVVRQAIKKFRNL